MNEKTLQKARRAAYDYYSSHKGNHYGHLSHLASEALEYAEKKYDLPTFGVEGIIDVCLYLNAGDTYDTTLLAVDDVWGGFTFRIGNWGDLVEKSESRED